MRQSVLYFAKLFVLERLKIIKKDLVKFEYGFFNISEAYISSASKGHCDYNDPDSLNYEKANSIATLMLIQNKAEKALPLINRTVLHNPSGIQPLINKGIALLQLPDPTINELEIISAKFKELTQNRCSFLLAKVYYTYWLWCLSSGEFESCIEALESFESVLAESNEGSDVESAQLQSCLYCAKTIYRMIRDFSDDDENVKWMTENELVKKGFQMLRTMATCDNSYYKLESWIWLSEFQQLYGDSPLIKDVKSCLSQLQTEAGYECCDIINCISNAMIIFQSFGFKALCPEFDANEFYGRLGKSYYFLAINNPSIDKRVQQLEKAIDFASKYLELKLFQAYFLPDLCIKILLHLWAVKYYQIYGDCVEAYLRRDYTHRGKL